MIFVNAREWDFFEYVWECLDVTSDRRTVLNGCDCGFESNDQRFDFIYMGF